jgi:hypothetical protein
MLWNTIKNESSKIHYNTKTVHKPGAEKRNWCGFVTAHLA